MWSLCEYVNMSDSVKLCLHCFNVLFMVRDWLLLVSALSFSLSYMDQYDVHVGWKLWITCVTWCIHYSTKYISIMLLSSFLFILQVANLLIVLLRLYWFYLPVRYGWSIVPAVNCEYLSCSCTDWAISPDYAKVWLGLPLVSLASSHE